VAKDESITKKPDVRKLYLRRASDLHRSDQFEKYHYIYKPDDEPTSGKLLLELRNQWNSGPGKTYYQDIKPEYKLQRHCGQKLLSQATYRTHLFNTHGINIYNFACNDCNSNFQAIANLQTHVKCFHLKPVFPLQQIKNENQQDKNSYSCVSCESILNSKSC
jgi:hypothetical protein